MDFYSVLWDVGRLPGENQNRIEERWKTGSEVMEQTSQTQNVKISYPSK